MLDEQSTGTTADQSADSAHRSRGQAASSPAARVATPTSVPAELSALAQRVATARNKLPLQADPALFAELSDREITAERELAEWIRTQRRQQRKRAVSAELTAEKRDRRVALTLRRADESDARWHRRARAARMRVSNSDARLAQLFRRAEWSSRALIGVVILGMVWAGVNVQHNLVPSGDMSDPLYWLSYGFEAMISIPIITIMVVATTAARWGREIDRGKVVFLETALLGVTIALNAGPHLVGGEPARAAEAAVAPVMVGVVIWLHSWVSARYAQLIDDIPVEEIDSDDPRPSGYRPSYRPDDHATWAGQDALPVVDPDFHSYPQLAQMLATEGVPLCDSPGVDHWNTFAPHSDSAEPTQREHDTEPAHPNIRDLRPSSEIPMSPVDFTNSEVPNSTHSSNFPAIKDNSAAPAMPVSAATEQPAAATESASHSLPDTPVTTAQSGRSESPAADTLRHHTQSPGSRSATVAQPIPAPASPEPAGESSDSTSPGAAMESERAPRRTDQREGTALHIVSDEPRKTRTRRAVDDAVQLVLGEPIAESPRTTHPAAPATSTVADTASEPTDRGHRPVGNLGAAAAEDPADAESDAPDVVDDEFEPDDIDAVADEHAQAEGSDIAIWSVARQIRERGLSKLPVEQLAEILTLTDESWTPAAIGAAVGLPGSRILGILETARRISLPLAVGG
ncbi:hypothetical protein AB0L57_13060 [Nocardia sp. NPDC052254]|uniref:hypothetical protein n=1 Tax=Nocardia sp. NPDC052254 TaxID=3155681 RepID=UPI003425DC5F